MDQVRPLPDYRKLVYREVDESEIALKLAGEL